MTGETRARCLYRALLVVLPSRFRQEAEPDLLTVFDAAHTRVAAAGVMARTRFWVRTVADLLITAAAERRPRGSAGDRGGSFLAGTTHDVRDAWRGLLHQPGWTLLNAGTLALGLAATITAIVLVRDVLLQPLPFPASDRLVRLIEVSSDGGTWWPSFPNAIDWREQATFFSGVGIADLPSVQPVVLDGAAVRVPVSRAARGLFETLGTRPIAGRLFTSEENRPGGAPVAIVSERFWRSTLGARPMADLHVGIGETTHAVVGVLPRTFRFLGEGAAWSAPADVWTPMDQAEHLGGRTSHGYHVVARLRDGITLERARADMNALAARLKREHGEPTQADTVRLTPLQDLVVRRAREPLQWLLYAALAVLGVACLNLAAAILAQGLRRTRELSIRVAVGASRVRVARHLLIGSAALAIPGVVGGLALAAAALAAIRTLAAHALPRIDEAGLDGRAAAIAVTAALATAVLAGMLPSLLLSSPRFSQRLRVHGAGGSAGARRLWPAFIVIETALSMLLLAGTGLLVRSFVAAVTTDLGYAPGHVLAVDVTLSQHAYQEDARKVAFYDAALARLRSTPGITAAGLTSVLPHETSAYTANTQRHTPGGKSIFAGYRMVDAGYFDALGIRKGRIDPVAFAAGGAVIDRTLQDVLWPQNDPIGDRLDNSFSDRVLNVAGLVGTVKEWDQDEHTIGAVYVDFHSRPSAIEAMHFVVRYSGDERSAAAAVRRDVAEIDPLVPVTIEALRTRATASMGDRRFFLAVAIGFGLSALLLSAVGVYSLVSFAVGRSVREAAIRLALGAPTASVQSRLARVGLLPALIGVGIGLAGSTWMGSALRAQLFHVQPQDPLVLCGAAAAALLAAGLASAFPARRATRLDPSAVLRIE